MTVGEEMTTPTRQSCDETARLGAEIYERDIRSQAEADHFGEVVATDVGRGDYAIGDMVVTAAERLWQRRPDAADVWSVRVGYRTLRHFGGSSLRRTG